MRKSPFLLLEVLIGLSLSAILLTFLFSFFVESARMEKRLEMAHTAIAKRAHLQTRLQTIFNSLEGLRTQQEENEMTLFVTYNNGIDPEPAFSGTVMGHIFVDAEKNLVLTLSPPGDEKRVRTEVLYSHVEKASFEFLGSAGDGKKEKCRPITPNLAWRDEWQQGLTSLIRLKIQEETQKEPVLFAFVLLSPGPTPTYLGKKST